MELSIVQKNDNVNLAGVTSAKQAEEWRGWSKEFRPVHRSYRKHYYVAFLLFARRLNLTEAMSEDFIWLCHGGYENFWPVPAQCTG